MGTTLTGTTPQDTYDSLIKVTDNGPLSGTAKYLSDGLGNDSVLALSTARVFIGKTTNNNTFNSRLQVVSDNTTAGGVLVDHFQNDATGAFLFLAKSRSNVVGTSTIVQNNDTLGQIDFNGANGSAWSLGATIAAQVDGTAGATNDMPARLIFSTSADGSATPTERMRITSAGNVGIGTSSPASKLHVKDSENLGVIALGNDTFPSLIRSNAGSGEFSLDNRIGTDSFIAFRPSGNGATQGAIAARIDSDGLKFGSDTAAANALDDYEEGTFTAQLIPTTSGSITLNASYTSFFYTKIGRQVMVSGTAIVTSVASPVGNVRLEGLPFTSNSATSNIQAVNIQYYDNSATSFIFAAAYMGNNVSRITTSIDASTVAAGDEIYFTHTYNV